MLDYPFAALVGQEPLQTALLLNALYPGIGGVLVRGEKGTAKSTAARALAALLPPVRVVSGCPFHCDPDVPWDGCPHCGALAERLVVEVPAPFVDLPLGATEDRVLGALDFERALREGRRSFQPGLLAAAHRGVLYIDEVNLLPDHLVDVLLDAAAAGVNTVHREGVSVSHPARFLLIGTMNPEEGDLRPQLLDRFGLMVSVTGPREPEVRAEVVRRRLAFETDPAAFTACWAGEQTALRQRLVAARALLPRVVLDEGLLLLITRLCCELEVDGLRADIVLHKTARALAAFHGRGSVRPDDVRAAAELVLPHRQRRRPFERPELDRERLDNLLSKLGAQEESPLTPNPSPPQRGRGEKENPSPQQRGRGEKENPQGPGKGPAPRGDGSPPGDSGAAEAEPQVFAPASPRNVRPIELAPSGSSAPTRGRRNPMPARGHGHYVRAIPDEAPADLALDATIRAAARRGPQAAGRPVVERSDLHRKERSGRTGTLILFVVDASGSMAARRRMEAVKGAVLGLLGDAYEQRDQVGVIAFRGTQADVLLGPTGAVDLAEQTLRILPTGGRTPLAHALVLAHDTVRRLSRSSPDLPVLLVVLSDGKANVPLPDSSGDPWHQALQAAADLAADGVPALVLDTDAGFVRAGRARELAESLGAEYLALEELSADALVLKVRQRRLAGS